MILADQGELFRVSLTELLGAILRHATKFLIGFLCVLEGLLLGKFPRPFTLIGLGAPRVAGRRNTPMRVAV